MISLQPRETFQIVRQLGDHTNATTYYVRAVVRNSVDDTVLKTQNLTANATDIRRFKADYEVPADVSGLGFYIDITTSVYEDSGYTTKASTYSDELESYLVFDRIVRPGGSGGGGMDVDYKKIKKMIDDVVKKFPEMPRFDTAPIIEEIMAVGKKVEAIEIPEPEKVELSPILEAIDNSLSTTLKAIDNKEVTPPTDLDGVLEAIEKKDIDLSPVTDRVDRVQGTLDDFIDDEDRLKKEDENTSSFKLKKLSETVMPILSDIKLGRDDQEKEEENTLLARSKNLL